MKCGQPFPNYSYVPIAFNFIVNKSLIPFEMKLVIYLLRNKLPVK